MRRTLWLDDARQDLRYGLRSLAGAPGFTTVAVLTLALGIGANTAIFSVIHALLLKALPYEDSDRLVHVIEHVPAAASPTGSRERRVSDSMTVGELVELRRRTRALSHIACFSPNDALTLTGQEGTARLEGRRVEPAIFRMLGVQPMLGRLFESRDGLPGAEAVIILSYATWQGRLGADPNILGRRLTLDGERRSVIGVMPRGFDFPFELTGWEYAIPLVVDDGPDDIALPTMARLADGVSIEAAAAEVGTTLGGITARRSSYELIRVQDELVAPVKPAVLVLAIAVGFVLLIACVNVANLLLARTAARQREVAIRVALGAGRGRVIRQLLTECVLLALLGGIGGIVVAWGGIRLLGTLATTLSRMDLGSAASFPRLDEIAIDVTVLAFSLTTSVVTGLLFGLAPAIRHSHPRHMEVLRQGATSAASGFQLFRHHHARGLLVVTEITMAMMLLVGGGLLMHSFVKLASVDPGYHASGVLTFQVALPEGRYPDEQLEKFAEELVARLRSVPTIRAAAYTPLLPMVGLLEHTGWFRRTPDPSSREGSSDEDFRGVSQDYFEVMGIRVVAGRGFDEHDRAGQPRAIVINQALARRDFPGEKPIGQVAYLQRDTDPWEIVGIVEDVRQLGLDEQATPQVFVDSRQWPGMAPGFRLLQYYAVRTDRDPMAVLPSVRAVVRGVDQHAGVYNVAPMERLVANSIARPRLYAVLVSIFAAVALTLASIGLYGTMAYAVAQRTREIGIRMALGARRADVLRLVIGQSLVLTLLGIGVGLAGAALLTRYLEGMLFGLTPLDPSTFVAVSVLFAAVATFAAYVPARRATRVDPSIALRDE